MCIVNGDDKNNRMALYTNKTENYSVSAKDLVCKFKDCKVTNSPGCKFVKCRFARLQGDVVIL